MICLFCRAASCGFSVTPSSSSCRPSSTSTRKRRLIIWRQCECKSEFKGAAHCAVRVRRSWPSAWSSASPSPWWPSTSSSFLARSTGRSPPSPPSRYLSLCPGLPRGGDTEQQSRQHQWRITASEKKRAFFPSAEEEGKCPDVQIRREHFQGVSCIAGSIFQEGGKKNNSLASWSGSDSNQRKLSEGTRAVRWF